MHSTSFITFLAALPATLACLAYDEGLPSHTDTKSLSEPQYIGEGEVFDAKWVKVSQSCVNRNHGTKPDLTFLLVRPWR